MVIDQTHGRGTRMINVRQFPYQQQAATREPMVLRWALIGIAVLFMTVMLVIPLVAVFYEALKSGWDLYLAALTEPEALNDSVNFLVGRKIRQEEYILEHHQVRYCAYAQRLATPMEHFTGEMKNIGNTLITFHIFHRLPLLMYCRKLLQKNWMD